MLLHPTAAGAGDARAGTAKPGPRKSKKPGNAFKLILLLHSSYIGLGFGFRGILEYLF